MIKNYNSLNAFCDTYSNIVGERYLISPKDLGNFEMIQLKPFYLLQFIIWFFNNKCVFKCAYF